MWDASARAGFAELLPPGTPVPAADGERFLALFSDPAVRILVADEGAELFGHTTFGSSRDEDAEADVGEIRAFFVSPCAWRRGLGRALMAAALAGLRELQYEQATLWSFDATRERLL